MNIRAGSWVGRGLLVLVAVVGLVDRPARAQYNPGFNTGPGGPMPQLPPKGAWGEIIMANAKWIVVQNELGQQFPIAASDNVAQFLVRWPTNAAALTPNSLIEAIGQDKTSNTLLTDHIDVYEGPAQSLVTPSLRQLLGDSNRQVTAIDPTFSRSINSFDPSGQYSMYSWAYPIPPGNQGIERLYAVGYLAGLNPLRLRIPGDNFATVLPAAGNFSMWQVTRGSTSMAKKGDVAFLMPTQYTPKSLILSQLVIFKKIPLNQFVP